eukprot:COSAG06_NODE_3298_length_5538_cov_3.853833_8_plen_54_part_00
MVIFVAVCIRWFEMAESSAAKLSDLVKDSYSFFSLNPLIQAVGVACVDLGWMD